MVPAMRMRSAVVGSRRPSILLHTASCSWIYRMILSSRLLVWETYRIGSHEFRFLLLTPKVWAHPRSIFLEGTKPKSLIAWTDRDTWKHELQKRLVSGIGIRYLRCNPNVALACNYLPMEGFATYSGLWSRTRIQFRCHMEWRFTEIQKNKVIEWDSYPKTKLTF